MASAIVMNSPVHQISLPPGCTAVVEEPVIKPHKEQGSIPTSITDLNQPRSLSPAASFNPLSPPSASGDVEERRPLMHSTPYPSLTHRRLPTPPLPHQGDSSGYASSQTPPVKIVNSSNSHIAPGSRNQQDGDEAVDESVRERDKWQFPVIDRPTSHDYSGYDSDLSEPSPYAVVKNLIADVEPRGNSGGACHHPRQNRHHDDTAYEEIEMRCLPSLRSMSSHSTLERFVPPWQIIGPPTIKQPLSIKAALRENRGLCPMVQQQLRKAEEFLHKKQLKEAISCLEWSLVQTNDYPHVQSLIWMLLGKAQVSLADFNKASICHLHYLAFCRERNDFPGMTRAECSLGVAYMKLGLYKLAGRCFLQYLENCHLLQDDKGISVAYNNLGLLSKILATESYVAAMKEGNMSKANDMLKSNLKRAVTYFEQHLSLEEQFENVNKQSSAFGNLGTCNELLKQYTQAIFCHNKRLEISRSIGDRSTESCALCNLGNCFRAIGKLEEALQYYILNLELTRSIEHKSGEVVTLLNLGTTYELLNKIDQAIEWYTLYLSMTVQRNDVPGQARGLCILASLYHETGQLLKAHEYYKKMVGIFHQLGERDAESSAQQFIELTRRAIEREKRQNKSLKWKKKRASKKANTVSRATGLSLANPATTEVDGGQLAHSQPRHPHRMRPPLAVDGIATLTAAQRTEFEKIKRQANMRSMESLTASCVFENPAYTHFQENQSFTHNQELYNNAEGVPDLQPRAREREQTAHNPYYQQCVPGLQPRAREREQTAHNPYYQQCVPGLQPRAREREQTAHNPYYQQWIQRRTSVEGHAWEQDTMTERGVRRSTASPIFSDSGWSHTSTTGLSPDSTTDWIYPYPYTIGGGFNLQAATAAQYEYPMEMSRPACVPGYNPTPSQHIQGDGGYAQVMRVNRNNESETETNSDYASIREEEEEEEEEEGEAERDDDGEITSHISYQDCEDEINDSSHRQPRVMRSASSCSVIGSQRHFQEIERISHDFTHPNVDQELELSEGVDKEWEQWIKMQEDDALTRVVSMREQGVGKYRKKYRRKPRRSFSCRPAISAPHLGNGEPPISEEDLSNDTTPYSSDS